MCGATTLPKFRRRGLQTSLLNARLRDAGAAGCDVAVVTTEKTKRRKLDLLHEQRLKAIEFGRELPEDRPRPPGRFGSVAIGLGVPTVVLIDSKGTENKALRLTGFEKAESFLARIQQVR